MSEFQYVGFRAIDGPVSEKNLEYMRGQSSRAEITAWAFDNEYHYGDFRGNAVEMLRRGYDLHLRYANFGIRKLLIRLPNGLPDCKGAEPYLGKESVQFSKDKEGPGGTLSVEPSYEPDHLEELWEVSHFVDRLVPLRAQILEGDLRPLYLAHLAVACDSYHDPEETTEAPVPAGLDKLTVAQRALMEFYGLDDSLIAAAAKESPPLAARIDPQNQYLEWLQGQLQATKDGWLARWMTDPHASDRREILAEFRKSGNARLWPTVSRGRTIAELKAAAEGIRHESDRKSEAEAARLRAKRLAEMADDPAKTLRETEELVARRSKENYRLIATLLADLREALAGSEQSGLAEQQAKKLKSKNPTLSALTAELRRQGFVPK